MEDIVTLYRPTGPRELALVAASGFRRWPPRLPDQPTQLDAVPLTDAACLAASYVSYLSEEYWCAGWLMDYGAETYRSSFAAEPVATGLASFEQREREDLARLRERLAPWWVEWITEAGGVALVRASSLNPLTPSPPEP